MSKIKANKAIDYSKLTFEELKVIRDKEREKFLKWENDFFNAIWDSFLNKAFNENENYQAKLVKLNWQEKHTGRHDSTNTRCNPITKTWVQYSIFDYSYKDKGFRARYYPERAVFVFLGNFNTLNEAKIACEEHANSLV